MEGNTKKAFELVNTSEAYIYKYSTSETLVDNIRKIPLKHLSTGDEVEVFIESEEALLHLMSLFPSVGTYDLLNLVFSPTLNVSPHFIAENHLLLRKKFKRVVVENISFTFTPDNLRLVSTILKNTRSNPGDEIVFVLCKTNSPSSITPITRELQNERHLILRILFPISLNYDDLPVYKQILDLSKEFCLGKGSPVDTVVSLLTLDSIQLVDCFQSFSKYETRCFFNRFSSSKVKLFQSFINYHENTPLFDNFCLTYNQGQIPNTNESEDESLQGFTLMMKTTPLLSIETSKLCDFYFFFDNSFGEVTLEKYLLCMLLLPEHTNVRQSVQLDIRKAQHLMFPRCLYLLFILRSRIRGGVRLTIHNLEQDGGTNTNFVHSLLQNMQVIVRLSFQHSSHTYSISITQLINIAKEPERTNLQNSNENYLPNITRYISE